jgi:hypothetical protein
MSHISQTIFWQDASLFVEEIILMYCHYQNSLYLPTDIRCALSTDFTSGKLNVQKHRKRLLAYQIFPIDHVDGQRGGVFSAGWRRFSHLLYGLYQLFPALLELPGTLDQEVGRAHVRILHLEAPDVCKHKSCD